MWFHAFSPGAIALVGVTLVLVLLPLWQLDEWHLFTVMAAWLLVWVAAWSILRAYRRHLLALLLFLPAAGLVCELTFRLQVFGMDGLSFDRYRPAGYAYPWSTFAYDASTYTGLKGDQSLMFKGGLYTVTHHGFRGRNVPWAKPDGVYRIVVTGASASMGAGVHDEDVVFARLERMLNESMPDRTVEVINLSMGGAEMGHMLHTLRHAGMAYEPDLVLFFVDRGGLRINPEEEPHLQVRKIEKPVWRLVAEPPYRFFNSLFFFFQAAQKHTQSWRERWLRLRIPYTRFQFSLHSGAPADRRDPLLARLHFERGLDRLQEIVGDVPVALYALRPGGRRGFGDPTIPFADYVERAAQERGMQTLMPRPGFDEGFSRHELILYPGDAHPNALHHGLFAEAYFEDLRRMIAE